MNAKNNNEEAAGYKAYTHEEFAALTGPTPQEIEAQIAVANHNIETVAAYLDANPDFAIPSTFNGLGYTIAGVWCVCYSSGVIRIAPLHLPSHRINFSRIEMAVERHRAIQKAARSMLEAGLVKSYRRLWAHDGKKFVRVA